MNATLRQVDTVEEGLAFEAELFSSAEQHVAVWQSATPALVAPKAYQQRSGMEAAMQRSAERDWPVYMRPSGGGTVPLGPGVLNLVMALTVPQGFGIHTGYQLLCEPIIAFGQTHGLDLTPGATPDSFCDGDWNLSAHHRKLVGTAQRLRPLRQGRVRLLAHALILAHDPVEVGAEAVDHFHRDLGLDPIRSDVHTTLQAELGHFLPTLDQIAAELIENAHEAIDGTPQLNSTQL